jgi:hypothetical protein
MNESMYEILTDLLDSSVHVRSRQPVGGTCMLAPVSVVLLWGRTVLLLMLIVQVSRVAIPAALHCE